MPGLPIYLVVEKAWSQFVHRQQPLSRHVQRDLLKSQVHTIPSWSIYINAKTMEKLSWFPSRSVNDLMLQFPLWLNRNAHCKGARSVEKLLAAYPQHVSYATTVFRGEKSKHHVQRLWRDGAMDIYTLQHNAALQ